MWVQYSVTIATLINYKLYKRPLNVLLEEIFFSITNITISNFYGNM